MTVERIINGMNMHLDLEDGGISEALYYRGEREKVFMSIMNHVVNEDMVCFDLGSNIGYTTLLMCRNVGRNGKVYGIEPDEHNLELLKKNISANDFENCEITHCAMSNFDGEIDFWMAESGPNLSSVQKTKHSTKKISVPCFTMK